MASVPKQATVEPSPSLLNILNPAELSAARYFVWRVLDQIPAELVEAALFGSKARGESRPDSDIDILLVFRELPPDREPQAGMAERIAEEVAAETDLPITVWSVSLPDLREGERTPMLVDALTDSVPLWCWPEPLEPVSFTPADALHCSRALLQRVGEGSEEFSEALASGDTHAAVRRGRDDLVRLGTALLLLRGVTRPRRGEVIDELFANEFSDTSPPVHVRLILDWARLSFGPSAREEGRAMELPPGGLVALRWTVDYLRSRVLRAGQRLAAGTHTQRYVY